MVAPERRKPCRQATLFTYEEGAMRHSRALRLSGMLALVAAAAVMLATAASAKQLVRETIHEEGTDVINDFCDVPGLTVEHAFVFDGRVQAVPHGRNRLAYFLERGKATDVFTNPANDKSITVVNRFIDKDLRVTDNGDGTLTITTLATGNSVVYGEDGKAIARNPGQIRFQFIIDHAGTPSNPDDDVFLTDLGIVKDSTGRNDDFCAAVVPALS
jgi:hypothetical protein